MNKKLLALAVAGAFVSPVAMADASVYGVVGMSVNVIQDGAASSSTSNNLSSNQSRVGVKGSEDLGGGLSAIVQMEATLAPDDGTGPTFSRNTFLGLKSADMGTLVVGNYDTAYKTSTRRLDVFADTMADNRGGTAGTGSITAGSNSGLMGSHDSRWTNAIAYASPAMNGLSVAVTSRFGAEGAASADTKGTAWSLAGMYEQGPIYATLALDNITYGSGTGALVVAGKAKNDESKAVKLGGGYTMDAITVNAVVEQLTDRVSIGGAETKGTNVYLAGKFAVSASDAVKVAYTKRGETTGTIVLKATQFAIGYDHAMSKNTSVYALYTKRTDDVSTPATVSATTAINGYDPSVISLGMKHAF